MKKRRILVSLALTSACLFSLGSCGSEKSPSETTTTTTQVTPTTTTTTQVTPTTTTTAASATTSTTVEETYTVSFESNGGTNISPVTLKKGEKVTQPQNMQKTDTEGRVCEFKGWYTDSKLRKPYDFNSEVNSNLTLYAKWFGIEEVTYSYIPEKYDSGTVTNEKIGLFTLSGSVVGRTKAWENPDNTQEKKEWIKSLNIKGGSVSFTAPGDGKATIYVQNGSSDADTQSISVTRTGKSTPTKYTFSGNTAVAPYAAGSPVVAITFDVEEELDYRIFTSGTVHVFEVDFTCTVEESEMAGIEIENTGIVDYLIGEDYDQSKLVVNLVYENGKIEQLSSDDEDLIIDKTSYDSTKAGTSKVKAKFLNLEEKEIDVNIYEVESISLGFNNTYLSKDRTLAGNSQYINGKVKKIYAKGEVLDTKYLSVYANAKLGNKTVSFLLNNRSTIANVSYDAIDTSTAGVKSVTVNYNGSTKVTTTYDVTVVDTAPVKDTNNNYIVNVNKDYTGVAGEADATLGNQFKTIGEALEYLEICNLDATSKKIMTIEAGTYNEKLEINVPNLTINGAGRDTTMIEWNSLWGTPDEGGYIQVTDSVQTVSVRESAVNCTFNNITISNWWNSEERFNSAESLEYLKKYGLYANGKVAEHRALALLVQSDKFTMENCTLLGYQDTVEFFKGRQYLHNCKIAGATDFIFGTNNTTLFHECEIYAIYKEGSTGGYTTAFMGCSSGEKDHVDYGAIFYKCNFTSDSRNTASITSLGRTWGPYAQVAIIECNIGGHISKKAASGATSNERYVAMQGSTPTTPTVRFVEYGNEGLGAITQSQAGVTYLTSTEAAKYHTISTIFGTRNGNVTYEDAWEIVI